MNIADIWPNSAQLPMGQPNPCQCIICNNFAWRWLTAIFTKKWEQIHNQLFDRRWNITSDGWLPVSRKIAMFNDFNTGMTLPVNLHNSHIWWLFSSYVWVPGWSLLQLSSKLHCFFFVLTLVNDHGWLQWGQTGRWIYQTTIPLVNFSRRFRYRSIKSTSVKTNRKMHRIHVWCVGRSATLMLLLLTSLGWVF